MLEKKAIAIIADGNTVTIPRMEYDRLCRCSTLLEVILVHSTKEGSWKLAEVVDTVRQILSGGASTDA